MMDFQKLEVWEVERTILLVDMNAFFASVEQICNPGLVGKPVIVGGAPGTRSVVAAASYEAREYGIRSAMPVMEALERCPELVIVSGNLEKYADTARRVFKIFIDFTDQVEIYSIDECFLDVTHTRHLFGGAWEIGREIKRRLKKEIGLMCSVGIAPNKLLAKLASGMRKPDGLTRIRTEEIAGLLENLLVGKLHGIGDKLEARLCRMGICTAGDLGRASRELMKREFGVMGEIMCDMGRGIDRSPIVPYYAQPDVKSMGHSYTMRWNTRDPDVVGRHLLRLSEMVGRRLREQGYAGRTVALVLRFGDMKTWCKRISISDHIDDGYDIYRISRELMIDKMDTDKRPVRLVGVCVSNLVKGKRQMSLFADPRKEAITRAMDVINDRYGEFTVKRASLVGLSSRSKTHAFTKVHT